MTAHWNVDVKDDRLISRWSNLRNAAKYDSEWMRAAVPREDRACSYVLDMSLLSPFGAANWYRYDLRPTCAGKPR